MDYSRLRPLLACPDCRVPLADDDGGLRCTACGTTYVREDGVPVLLSGTSQGVGVAGDAFFHRSDSREALTARHPILKLARLPSPVVRSDRLQKTKQVFAAEVAAGRGVILNLGSGVHKHYTNPNILNLDISRHQNVDVVGDGMALPLLDDRFDGAVLDAVLEHVPNPWRVAAEVQRVLKPGGFILVHAPFLYPYHGAPHDYFRYTDSGLRALLAAFEEEECDTDHLPTRALLEIWRSYAAIFADGRKASFLLRFLAAWTSWPFKFLDLYLQRKARSDTVVAGFSYLGRKPRP